MDKESILRELDISVQNEEKDKRYISKLGKSEDKVKYLRLIKNYSQEKAAKIIGITKRQVQRIEKKFNHVT
jgi:DNA-binding XRE family transcriptional regulator